MYICKRCEVRYLPFTSQHLTTSSSVQNTCLAAVAAGRAGEAGNARCCGMLRGWKETGADGNAPREQHLKAAEPAGSSSLFLNSGTFSLLRLGPLLNTGISLISGLPNAAQRFGWESLLHTKSLIIALSLSEFLLELPLPCAALTEPFSSSLMRSGDFHQIIVLIFAYHVCFSNFSCTVCVLLHLLW